MRTALLTATLLFSPLALAQDEPAAEEGAEEGAEGEEGTEEAEPELPEVDVEKAIKTCAALGLMDQCEIDGMLGLCQLEPCTHLGWEDGARACKQCVPYEMKPDEPPPVEPEPLLEEDEEVKKGKKGRRVKKRECGCDASGTPIGALALGIVAPLVIRRRRE